MKVVTCCLSFLGNVEEGSSTGDFERRMKWALEVWCVSFCGNSVKGTWREGSLAGGPWRVGRRGSGDGHLFPQGPVWGNWRRARLPGTSREG